MPSEPIIHPGDTYTPPEGTVRFADLPRCRKAWVFGKGPSFERVPWGEIGHPRISINDSALATPGCDYGFALDEWARWYRGVEFSGTIVSPWARECPDEHRHHWAPFAVIKKVYFKYPHKWADRGYLTRAQAVYKSGTSLASAFCFAWMLGAEEVETWGVDGGHEYGREWATHLHEPGFNKYDDGINFTRHTLLPILNLKWKQNQ